MAVYLLRNEAFNAGAISKCPGISPRAIDAIGIGSKCEHI
jgi:hypothetical protein